VTATVRVGITELRPQSALGRRGCSVPVARRRRPTVTAGEVVRRGGNPPSRCPDPLRARQRGKSLRSTVDLGSQTRSLVNFRPLRRRVARSTSNSTPGVGRGDAARRAAWRRRLPRHGDRVTSCCRVQRNRVETPADSGGGGHNHVHCAVRSTLCAWTAGGGPGRRYATAASEEQRVTEKDHNSGAGTRRLTTFQLWRRHRFFPRRLPQRVGTLRPRPGNRWCGSRVFEGLPRRIGAGWSSRRGPNAGSRFPARPAHHLGRVGIPTGDIFLDDVHGQPPSCRVSGWRGGEFQVVDVGSLKRYVRQPGAGGFGGAGQTATKVQIGKFRLVVF